MAEYAKFLLENDYNTEAVLRYQDLVRRKPENFTYCTLAGNSYLMAGLNSRALSAYQKANELAGEREGWILGNIGNLLNNRGLYAEAIKYFHRALEIEADSQYAHERLAQAQQNEADENKKLESLLEEARRTLSLGPSAPQDGDGRA